VIQGVGDVCGGSLRSALVALAAVAVVAASVLAWQRLIEVEFVAVPLAAVAAVGGARHRHSRQPPIRALLVGSPLALGALREDLAFHRVTRYALVGVLSPATATPDGPDDQALGTLADLRSVVVENEIDLIVMTSGSTRAAVFDALAPSWTELDVRLCELSDFYEHTFGYTPIAAIDGAWLHGILHVGYRPGSLRVKRVFDVAFALLVGLAFLPLLVLLACVIRRDGGPALYRQVRFGQGRRPFTLYKLRTMSVASTGEPAWATAHDPRVTPLGRRLRRLHLDELPQLWSILRGDMSVVGPRPEQPELVAALERELPAYGWRHALRPGLAGWAQARCGYAGSRCGAAWKLSHDLYYLKHRSLWFDLWIVGASIRHALTADPFAELRLTPLVIRPPRELPSPLETGAGEEP
jgi:lipopolysaccharide/colanic/teichoic acid biosynthesis glycosyltransferase